ncbi:hypothetical protein DPX16_14374 [Anabarilius grahami]|uniref:Uncharacterized protein n=1 Tax=Anabarilius grahami TaxID=495550 RepID=A0A3N0XLZ3_ANAGA|nr:hypothetical protein DPX16_14374 [Anabarilius grahami]
MVSSAKILLQRHAELRLHGGVGQGGSLCVPSRVLCVSCSMSHQTFTPHGRAQSVSQTCADLHYVSSRFATPFAVAVLLCAQTDLSIKRGLMDSSERWNNRLRRAAESRSAFFFDIRKTRLSSDLFAELVQTLRQSLLPSTSAPSPSLDGVASPMAQPVICELNASPMHPPAATSAAFPPVPVHEPMQADL